MADPRNANRARMPHPSIMAAASVAASRANPPAAVNFWDEDDESPSAASAAGGGNLESELKREDEERDAWLQERARESNRDSRRDEMWYRTALRTSFELGVKAGQMQRAEPHPCVACERRKERNRIAAQASRFEKRRLERAALEPPQRKVRRTGGAAPPPPLNPMPAPPAPRAAQPLPYVEAGDGEEDDEEGGADPPPF